MHAEPAVSVPPDELPAAMPDQSPDLSSGLSSEPDTDPLAAVPSELSGADPEATQRVSTPGTPDDSGADPEATQQVSAPSTADRPEPEPEPAAAGDDLDDTQLYRQPVDDAETLAPLQAPADDSAPPSPFPDIPERPLFAPTERRVPAAARAGQPIGSSPWSTPRDASGVDRAGSQVGTEAERHSSGGAVENGDRTRSTGNGADPTSGPSPATPTRKHEVHTGKEGRGWLRMAIVIGVTPRAGGRHGDRLQPRSPGRRAHPRTRGPPQKPPSSTQPKGRR